MSTVKIRPPINFEILSVRCHPTKHARYGSVIQVIQANIMKNVLFSMWGVGFVKGGLHYSTAHTACAIIADNVWDGYLSGEEKGPKLEIGEDGLFEERGLLVSCSNQTSPYPSTSEIQTSPAPDSPNSLPYPFVPTF
jgi:hypothetical protein